MRGILFWLRQVGLGTMAAGGASGLTWLLAGLFGGWREETIRMALAIEAILALVLLVGQLGLFRFFIQAWNLITGSQAGDEPRVHEDVGLTLLMTSFALTSFAIWLFTG